MINACVDPDFFLSEGEGVQAQRRENSLENVFMFVCFCLFFFCFFSPTFSGGGGGPNYLR